jgi:hypothetical protein
MTELQDLPPELITLVLSGAELDDIMSYCSSSRYAASICRNELLWRELYRRDYGMDKKYPSLSWLENYIEVSHSDRLVRHAIKTADVDVFKFASREDRTQGSGICTII